MFTGIVTATGQIMFLDRNDEAARVEIIASALDLADGEVGESIAVSGVCLTAVTIGADRFTADVSVETLACTRLGQLEDGATVNLERSLRLGDRLGGHLVSGHVDGLGEIAGISEQEGATLLRVTIPEQLARYVARKGSICMDGVSLTVNDVDGSSFSVCIIPHTWSVTSFKDLVVGTAVNIEVDQVARYLERLAGVDGAAGGTGLDMALLKKAGFVE
ncbi:MAG: riboflavin synthase [Gammaproteobacteria bacterium]|nr:riboflavin synthase [Gammaproteobacteria bacterium]